MDYKAQKVCDLINNAIDEIRKAQFSTLERKNFKATARLNEAEHLLLKALGMIGGLDAE
jgi:hypothetical protein